MAQNTPVRLLDLTRQNGVLEPELAEAFTRVLRSGIFINGPEVEAFERELSAFNSSRYALGLSSGTDALLVALMALGIGPGDEVICPSFTFFATAGSVARVGATPVFVDSCAACFNADVADVESKITPRTKAIIPVHLFGQAADMDTLMPLAEKHGLAVIEDAAQAMGATHRGRPLGTMGHFGTLSFFPSKNLGALGDAGGLLVQDEALYKKAKALRNHGMEPKYVHGMIGGNFRLDALQAALLRVKLPHFPSYTQKRRRHAEYYTKALIKIPGVRVAKAEECGCRGGRSASEAESARLVLPVAYPHNDSIWNQYTLRVIGPGQREALKARLTQEGIGCEIYYPVPLHEQGCFAYLGYKRESVPLAHRLAGEVLSLPVYPELTEEELNQVVTVIRDWLV